jgi:hypothetical protein
MGPKLSTALLVILSAIVMLEAEAQNALAAAQAKADPDVERYLRNTDQALLDAYAPGDVKVWEAALAPGAVYVDENGEIMDKSQFLKQLTPLPTGVTGNIHIDSYQMTIVGTVAIVVHTDREEEYYHGQTLHARYLTTETWQKNGEDWKLLLLHAYAILQDPPGISLRSAELDSYVGKYAAGDLVYWIRRDGDRLVGFRDGASPTQLSAEVRDVFFVRGHLRSRKIFQRDSNGRVTGFVDRREGVDLTWKRVANPAQ